MLSLPAYNSPKFTLTSRLLSALHNATWVLFIADLIGIKRCRFETRWSFDARDCIGHNSTKTCVSCCDTAAMAINIESRQLHDGEEPESIAELVSRTMPDDEQQTSLSSDSPLAKLDGIIAVIPVRDACLLFAQPVGSGRERTA